MYGCLQGSVFTMTADIYSQISDQDESTNAITRRWVILKNITCSVIPIRESGGSATSDNKTFGKNYVEELEVKMYTLEKLSKRWRVSGIKNSQKQELYTELDRISEPSTIFEVYASHPIFDMYGNVQYFENHLKRTQVQSND
jgi:transcription initiation factor TFIIIB Brf1 subunit/transcription initiation factor TFIIB